MTTQPESAAFDITELDELAMAEALVDLRRRVDAMRSELAELKESISALETWRQTMTGDGR